MPGSGLRKMPNMADTALSILVIDENRARAAIIEAGLREAGHERVTLVHVMAGIARRIEEAAPDVIVIDLENPNRDMLEDMFQLSRAVRRPVAMFVDRSDSDSIAAAVEAGVSAYVVDGLRRERIKPILDMAVRRFNAFARLSREFQPARIEIARIERPTIQRAVFERPASARTTRRAAAATPQRQAQARPAPARRGPRTTIENGVRVARGS